MSEKGKTEDYQNIDDLIDYDDYNDFETKDFALKSEKENDSFNDNIAKFYEDHKKKLNNKANEVLNSQRPISSYHRLKENNKSRKDEELEKDIPHRNVMNSELSPSNIIELNSLINRFKKFIQNNQITLDKFCYNPKLFLNFEDFCVLFRTIRFEFENKKEAMNLFMFKNPNNKEGFISIENFVKTFQFDFKQEKFETELKNDKSETVRKSEYLEDFRKINSEVFDIIRNDLKEENKNSLDKVTKYSYGGKHFLEKLDKKENIIGKNEKNIINNQISERPSTSLGLKTSSLQQINTLLPIPDKSNLYLKMNMLKVHNEEIKIRENFEKRDNLFLKDSLKKVNEINKICQEIGIQKTYSIVKNQDEQLKCRVYQINDSCEENTYTDINLKGVIIEWRMVNKLYQKHLEMESKYIETLSSKNIVNTNENVLITKNDKLPVKKEIEKMLISSIRLKTKLKQQVDSLKRNIIIDENLVLEELKKSLKLN